MSKPLSVLVTGASRGIGRAVVAALEARGYQVFAGVRRDQDGAALRAGSSPRVIPIHLDVTDSSSITASLETVQEIVGERGLFGLVNNAGIVMAGPLEGLATADMRRQLDVNVVGVLETIQTFLPLIRIAGGRIVNVSSVSGRVATRFVGAYAASKFALEALSDALRLELRPWKIPVVLIEPGAVVTDIWETSRNRAVDAWQDAPPRVRALYERVMRRLEERKEPPSRAIRPERVAAVVGRVMDRAKPRSRYVVGLDAKVGVLLARWLPTRVMDRLLVR